MRDDISRGKLLFKNIGILTVSNFSSKILVFLLVPLYTSILSSEEYGTYDIVYSTIQLLYPIFTLNIADAVMRFSMDQKYNNQVVCSAGYRVLLLGMIPCFTFMLLSARFHFISAISGYEILILLYYVFYCTYQFLLQYAKGTERVSDMGIAGILSTVILVLSCFLFLIIYKTGLKGFYLANTLAQAVPCIFLSVRLRTYRLWKIRSTEHGLLSSMFAYSIPLIVTLIGWWVNNTADKYTVVFMCGASAAGLISIAYKIPSVISVIHSIFVQAWQITAIKEYEKKDVKRFYGKSFSVVNHLLCIICSIIILFTKPVGRLLYQKEFFEAWQFVPFLVISCVFNSAAGFLGPILAAKKDSKSMALSALYGSAANIVLNIGLVYLAGVQGACIATLISSFIIFYFRKIACVNDVLFTNNKQTYIIWFLLIAQAVIEIYTHYWYIELLLIIVIAWMCRNQIMALYKLLREFMPSAKRKINNGSL